MKCSLTASRQYPCRQSILVVDDTPANVVLLKAALSPAYQITTSASGRDAVTALSLTRFDLILLDVKMQGMDGFQTLEHLQSMPNFDNTPVIFLTAFHDQEMERHGLSLGAIDYITKPYSIEHVKLKIDNVLQRSRLQKELSLAFDSAELGLWDWDLRANRVRIDPRRSVPLDLPPEDANGEIDWSRLLHPGSRPVLEAALHRVLGGTSAAIDVDIQVMSSARQWIWVRIHGKPALWNTDGTATQFMGTYQNIQQRKRTEEALRNSEERFRLVMEATGEGIWDWPLPGEVFSHNASWSRILGLDETCLSHAIDEFKRRIHPEDIDRVERLVEAGLATSTRFQAEYRIRHADGHYVWVQNRGKVVDWSPDGQPRRMVGSLKDITTQKLAEEEIHRLAYYDFLTGLPNRRLLVDRLGQTLLANTRSGDISALFFIDMDGFKALNDTCGHDAGDALLIEVANRLQESVRACDTVARLGGDEFVVMLNTVGKRRDSARSNAESVGQKILAALNRPYRLNTDLEFNSTASIGLALFAGAPETVDSILKAADNAMYAAKSDGRNCIRLAPEAT